MESRVVTDTTNIFGIDRGDQILIGSKKYLVTGHERERRFGVDDPKFWVKTALDLETGEKKIIKLSFFESFETSIGTVLIKRFRSPEKEAEILHLVGDHPSFMHGEGYSDTKGNNVRVLDIVSGTNFFLYIERFQMDHETYFHTQLPKILRSLITAFQAIGFLHGHGFTHGDIRNDHLIIERESGNYVWIDFDYDYEAKENPFGLDIFGLGNILIYSIGMGFHHFHMIKHDQSTYGDLKDRLEPGDFSILDRGRFVNMNKLYPYIPPMLNDILMHFSRGADIYFEYVGEVIDRLNWYLDSL
jgi:hypothetical protein